MFSVSRQIDFCYGHRLMGYSGKCRHLHGHNGRAVMRVTFKKPGTYIVSAPDDNASGISGTIKVVA